MLRFSDLEYCKTDLIAAKGVVFCKFHKSSAALRALEEINVNGIVAGYKVKCMLAEPKTKRKTDGLMQQDGAMFGPQTPKLDFAMNQNAVTPAAAAALHKLQLQAGMGMSDYAATISGLAGSLNAFNVADVQNQIGQALGVNQVKVPHWEG